MNTIMTRVLSVLCFFLAAGLLHAEGVVFFQGTWEAALAKAAKENKYIMLDAYTDWCGWCKVMDKNTFPDPEVGAVVNENFIPIKIDFEKGTGVDLGMKFRVNSYPTTLFFNPQGQLVRVHHGYTYETSEFIAECKAALAVKEERPFAFDSRNLKVPFPEFYRKSFLTGENRAWPKEEEVTAFLDKQPDLFSEVSWSVMWRFGGSEKHQLFLLTYMQKYAQLYGKEDVEERVLSMIQNKVHKAAQEKDETALAAAVKLIDQYFNRDDKDLLKLIYKQYYYQQTEDWKMYADISGEIITMENYGNPGRVNSICWTLYEKTDDTGILQRAVIWMKPIIEQAPEYAWLDTYAALLYKTGDLSGAEKFAKRAIEQGKEAGEDVAETEKLLSKIQGAKM